MVIHSIQKQIVTDENMHPVVVQISYEDWLKIESVLNLHDLEIERSIVDLSCFSGKITLDEDPLEYQRRVRDEWP